MPFSLAKRSAKTIFSTILRISSKTVRRLSSIFIKLRITTPRVTAIQCTGYFVFTARSRHKFRVTKSSSRMNIRTYLLEARFVQQLATKSNIVIAGDDDQSVYSFRHASNKYIRELWKLDEFKKFRLPFCSRCTPVAIEAANSFVANVQKYGLLAGRIE